MAAKKMRFQITAGPGKGDLVGSCFFGTDVKFTLISKQVPSGIHVKTRWIGVQSESGGGERWLIHFSAEVHTNGEDKPHSRKFHGYFDSRIRKGYVDMIL
jgi:hypothetical protein